MSLCHIVSHLQLKFAWCWQILLLDYSQEQVKISALSLGTLNSSLFPQGPMKKITPLRADSDSTNIVSPDQQLQVRMRTHLIQYVGWSRLDIRILYIRFIHFQIQLQECFFRSHPTFLRQLCDIVAHRFGTDIGPLERCYVEYNSSLPFGLYSVGLLPVL